jgi:hypothetical protein
MAMDCRILLPEIPRAPISSIFKLFDPISRQERKNVDDFHVAFGGELHTLALKMPGKLYATITPNGTKTCYFDPQPSEYAPCTTITWMNLHEARTT